MNTMNYGMNLEMKRIPYTKLGYLINSLQAPLYGKNKKCQAFPG
jgi:hypothetical protein